MASVYQTISDELYLGQLGPDAILPADLLGCWKRCSTLSGFHSQPSVICQDMARVAINLFVFVCECVRLTLGFVSNSSQFPLSLILSFPKTSPTQVHGGQQMHRQTAFPFCTDFKSDMSTVYSEMH